MRTSSVAVIGVVLACIGCQPRPSLEEQCVRARESNANSMRVFHGPDCNQACQINQVEVMRAAEKWIEKVCK